MKHEVLYRPSYSLLRVTLEQDEAIAAEAGAMVSMSSSIEIQTKARGGVFGALKRSMFGGESFFMNTFRAAERGEVTLAPALPGEIYAVDLSGGSFFAQSGAYVASSPEIQVDTKWGGARTFFSREGLFLLKLTGTGTLFLSSYGAVHEIELAAGQEYIVDTGHMVAFDETVGYHVTKVGGLKSTLFSGEGLVCRLTGPGKILIQSRSTDAFLSWLIPQLPKRNDS
jgi:uncharacterized protein (TIGR00266 family)